MVNLGERDSRLKKRNGSSRPAKPGPGVALTRPGTQLTLAQASYHDKRRRTGRPGLRVLNRDPCSLDNLSYGLNRMVCSGVTVEDAGGAQSSCMLPFSH